MRTWSSGWVLEARERESEGEEEEEERKGERNKEVSGKNAEILLVSDSVFLSKLALHTYLIQGACALHTEKNKTNDLEDPCMRYLPSGTDGETTYRGDSVRIWGV